MRVSKALFVVGFILLLASIAIAVIGATGETWEHKEQPFVEEILTVPGGWHLSPFPKIIILPENSRDILVAGTVKELKGEKFDLYVLNKRNYELRVANASYKAYVDVKDVSSYSLSLSPTREDIVNVLYFVVVNKNPFLGPNISVEFSIKISWTERSYAAAAGGFVLGTLLGGLGLVLVIVAAAMRFVFGRDRGKTTQPSLADRVGAKGFCTNCGAPISANLKFCSRCGSPGEPDERRYSPICNQTSDQQGRKFVQYSDVNYRKQQEKRKQVHCPLLALSFGLFSLSC